LDAALSAITFFSLSNSLFSSPIISLFDQTGIGQAFDLGQYRIIEQE
jgi:hypothetical protein